MKHEWRKKEKEFYIPKEKPQLVKIPKFKFLTIKGEGNPNSEKFTQCIGVLYSLSYAIRMMPKGGFTPSGYEEYTVYPLEGLWDLSEEGRIKEVFDKNELIYTLMIRQPEFVTEEIFNRAMEITKMKKPHPLLETVKFETIEDGLSVQMLHVGSYDNEPKTFAVMQKFIEDNNLQLKTKVHREIYLSDFRRVEESKLKTVLRYKVEGLESEKVEQNDEVNLFIENLDYEGKIVTLDFIDFMNKEYPQIKPRISFKMPMWCTGEKMREGYVAISTAKNHYSIHFLEESYIEKLKNLLPSLKYGKRCINIPYKDEDSKIIVKNIVIEYLNNMK